MSNYQRLISYIYTYEGGIKGKNTGFAKLETRGNQCRLTLSVKKVFAGANPLGIYLLSGDGERRIGTLFVRNGSGEFRTVLNTENVEGSHKTLEEFYGLTIHDVESNWRAYTTMWEDEDAVAHAAAVDLAEVTSENVQNSRLKDGEREESLSEEAFPISKEIERELLKEENADTEEKKKKGDCEGKEGTGENQNKEETAACQASEPLKEDREEVRGAAQEADAAKNGENGGTQDFDTAFEQTDSISVTENETDGGREEGTGKQEMEGEPERTAWESREEAVSKTEAAPAMREEISEPGDYVILPGRRNISFKTGQMQGGVRARLIGRSVPPPLQAGARTLLRHSPQESISAGEWVGRLNGGGTARQAAGAVLPEEQKRQELLQKTREPLPWQDSPVPSGQKAAGQEEYETATERDKGGETVFSRRGSRLCANGREMQNAERFAPLEREDPDTVSHQRMWARLRRKYPKILAFDYDDGCEILTIKPQDIGLLPREVWVFGNNSFLLHGYYSYRYLILARLENPQGEPRYLLGVPGHYQPNEKYMASMFGFPDFVLSKKQPAGDDSFGYWYTDIRVGE